MTKFGISLGCSPRESISHSLEILREADRLGVDCAWIIDSQMIMKDAYVIMALASAQTRHIKFGTGVTNPVTRHPAVTANTATSLNEVSGGRYIIGIGSGDSALRPLGQKPCTLKETEESIVLMRRLMQGETVEHKGAPLTLKTAAGPVPITVAASQPGMLRLAGRVADGVIIMGVAEPGVTQQQIALIREGAESVGRKLEDIELDLWVTMSCRDDEAQALADVRSWCTSQARWLYKWVDKPPSVQAFQADLETANAAYDFSEHLSLRARHQSVVSDDFCRLVSIPGNEDYCVGRLKELAGMGLQRITVTLLSGGRLERLRVLMEEIAPRVL